MQKKGHILERGGRRPKRGPFWGSGKGGPEEGQKGLFLEKTMNSIKNYFIIIKIFS